MAARLFVGNFELEHQLAGSRDGSVAARRLAAEMACVWLAVAEDGDWLWMPEPPDPTFLDEMKALGFPQVQALSTEAEVSALGQSLEVCPWGWSHAVQEWAGRLGCTGPAPPLAVVRQANSRRFSFDLEQELGMGLDGSAMVHSLADWQAALASFSPGERWVIKAEFGMSARERLFGQGPVLSPATAAWGQKRLNVGQPLFLEPWVEVLAEAGLQFDVPPRELGPPYCVGITPILTDRLGTYRGSRFDLFAETETDWSAAVETGQLAARRLQALGYVGPLGLDAAWYRAGDGTRRLRPLQDVNARWTMGRLSLGFRRRLNPEEGGVWLHQRCPATSPDEARAWWDRQVAKLPAETRLLRTSPLTCGAEVTKHVTCVLISSNPHGLIAAPTD